MSYVPVEADDHVEEGRPELEFKNFDDLPAPRRDGGASRPGFISDAPSRASPWALEYYQPLFDVSTRTVITRCLTTMNPFSLGYTTHHLSPQPDLYGPFWTLTTLIFFLFVTSSLASSVASYLSDSPINYDFELLSVAAGVVYAYGLAVPAALWGILRWWGVVAPGGEGWGLVEAWACWGYAMFVWIPVSILCIIPSAVVRWTLVGIAFGLSGYFLVANVYPILASSDHKYARALIVLVAVLHAALALVFKVEFFAYYVVKNIGPADPIGEAPALRF